REQRLQRETRQRPLPPPPRDLLPPNLMQMQATPLRRSRKYSPFLVDQPMRRPAFASSQPNQKSNPILNLRQSTSQLPPQLRVGLPQAHNTRPVQLSQRLACK